MKKMTLFTLITLAGLTVLSSCKKDEDTEEIITDSSKPSGDFSVSETGTFVEQNDSGTEGTASLGTDEDGVQFLKLGSDFMTNLATGTVTIYLSTSATYTADPGNGNPDLRLAGIAVKNGETYYKLDPKADAKFTRVIAWCASAGVPFGYVALMDK